jgi:hypothetical protein
MWFISILIHPSTALKHDSPALIYREDHSFVMVRIDELKFLLVSFHVTNNLNCFCKDLISCNKEFNF